MYTERETRRHSLLPSATQLLLDNGRASADFSAIVGIGLKRLPMSGLYMIEARQMVTLVRCNRNCPLLLGDSSSFSRNSWPYLVGCKSSLWNRMLKHVFGKVLNRSFLVHDANSIYPWLSMSERTFHSGQPHLAPRSFFGVEDFLDDDNSRPYTYQKGKKSKNPTKHISFKQRTVAYMEPFTLDVLVMKRSVSASLTHRVTSRQVAVAGTNSKDIKAVLKSRSDIPACVAVGRILAERAKEADVFTATYTPRERDKFEGKIRAVVQSIIDNDAHWATTCGTFYGSVPRIRARKEASRAYPFNGCWARTRNFSVECSAKRFRKNSKPGKGGTNDNSLDENSLDENRSVSSSDGSSLKVDRAQEDDVARLEGSAARSSAAVPSRDSVLRACVVTSGLLAALGAGIRQVSHVAFAEGLPVTDCTKEVTFGFEIWHLELVAGLVILISSSRYLLLKIWPDFAESSAAANLQVLTSLKPLDYPVVAFLPGVGEELLFRGALIPVIGLNWTSVLVVASLFGVLHLGSGRNYSFAVWATFVGFMYGWATIASGSVVAPMAAHALNNLVGGVLWRYDSSSSR
ncbi:hypothetical protein SAY87_001718 [Trapa incisa]|uniref:CAAX prenyl protease 2/Lysostaphin resistance protein A-like domain-containing protein n=1 Tax=Trapa incisa TaxID=236973 RepID=A0AAN7JVG0_9MYRT|nr:hypothetical protein SAY87_001718 [Trapa incisa]